ncbi:AAA domain protein [Leptospira interrogans serovar Pyrogenes str. 200701872]|uniref:AAA domain protein n=2 Tax=Leptospira interrogans TaxID=173 RepID=M6ZDM0_LEPIR|nr:AAA domain protein [Leptospira interrogans serovar Pyrogenes str. 200701872]EMY23360.1 AAA domain protein [Leptospira interrogans serovar Australis str. 200703203]
MYLKSLNIVGFKTFADETEILLDPGFTAVVGPNGSGKSNIVDAVKWVFGEKSAKGLRGDKMDDVIFHGSEARKPAGYAEVSVIFDNSSKLIKMDYPTVKMTRRLYMDGNNEYCINDSRVQRKDVEKLLMDTGIGKSSYSIMEQGKVDRILHSKPEERRLIFEEAAGISRFKVERQEALKRLEDTKQNLLRIQDIMGSMKKEMEIKEKQAEKAEAYFKLKSELDETDKIIRYLKFSTLTKKLKASEEELQGIKDKNQILLDTIGEETGRIEILEKDKSEIEKRVSEIDKKLYDHLSQTKIQKEKIEKNKQIILEYEERISEMTEILNGEESSLSLLVIDLERIQKECFELEGEIELLQEEIQKLKDSKSGLEKQIEDENLSVLEKESRIATNDKSHNELREKLKEVIFELISQLESRKKEAIDTENRRKELKEFLLSKISEYSIQIEELRRNLEFSEKSKIAIVLETLQLGEVQSKLEEFVHLEDMIRNILFDRDGFLSRKETLDQQIEDLILENENLTRSIKDSGLKIESLRENLEANKEQTVFLEKKVLELSSEKNSRLEICKSIQLRKEEIEKRIQNAKDSIQNVISKKQEFEKEVSELEQQIESSYNEFLDMSRALESEKESLRNILKEIQNLKHDIQKNQDDFKNLIPVLTEKERTVSGLKVQIDSFTEELYNDYSISEQELVSEFQNRNLERTKEEVKLKN